MNRSMVVSLLVVVGSAMLGAVLVHAADKPDETARRGAWQPEEADRSAYRDIIDFNIFRSDRRRLAEKVDRERNPPPPKVDTPREPVRVTQDTPRDPDADWRVAGITHEPGGSVVFMENTAEGVSKRITDTGDFASGEITDIGYDTIVYVVASESRSIRVGDTLLGTRSALSAAPKATSGSTSGSSKTGGSVADRLRALREKRALEQGTAPPPAPEQTDQPNTPPSDQPADQQADQKPQEQDPITGDAPSAQDSDQP